MMRPNVGMSRTAETMPFVTLPSSPSGLPITTTLSPSCGDVLSSGNGLIAGDGGSILSSAISPSASTASTPLTGITAPVEECTSARCAPSMTCRLVTMRSTSMKKPLPRDSFSPRESKVSTATADGFIRRTSSGRRSWDASTLKGIIKTSKSQASFISSEKTTLRTRQRQLLNACNNVRYFNILALFRAAIVEFDQTVRGLFPNRHTIRDADQIRIFEFDARAFVAIVQQHVEPRALHFFVERF